MSYLIPPPTPGPGSRFLQGEEERTPLLLPSAETLANVSHLQQHGLVSAADYSILLISQTQVYPLIHLIRVDVTSHIDTPLTIEQLLAPDSTYTIVR
jgi:hypothetical protein